jgi:Calx-beta domain-containing protein
MTENSAKPERKPRPTLLAQAVARPGRTLTALVIVAYVFGVGLVLGGFGGASASTEYEYSTTLTTTTTTSTTTSTTTPTVTKPGKGCGDKNHLHERRFECKVAIGDALVKEGAAGVTSSLVLTVELSGSPLTNVTVDYATSPGTATAGVDYLPISGALSFPVGVSTRTLIVTVIGDKTPEPNETLLLNLSNPSPNAYIGDGQAVGTIRNDD